MENLPEKILFKIFRYIPRLKELTSVSRHWKTAVESYKVFEKLSFKETFPDDINYLVQSKRLYRQLDVTLSQKSLDKLMIFLEHSQKTVEFLRIKVTRDGIFPLFSKKEFPDREGRENLIKFQNLERFQLECFQHDDVMFIYRSCDLSGIRQLATNDFPGRDLVVQHVLDIVPNISDLQVINRERTPRLPPRLQGMVDDLEYATQKFCADTLNLVIFVLILVAVIGTIFIQFYF